MNVIQIICKWRCDGSHQAQFKQRFENQDESYSNIFQSSLVPLHVVCGIGNKKIIWQNPTPSSPRYCRPIRIKFVKENTDITREEISYIKSKISNLKEIRIEKDKIKIIKHSMALTMIDTKVCNAAKNTTSTMKCYICGVTSKDFNNMTKEKEADPNTFQFGLLILHARIKFFESLLLVLQIGS